MNGIENIVRRLNEDAQREIDRILAAAKAEADEVTAHYERLAKQETDTRTVQQEQAAAEQERRLISAAQAEARKTVLLAKQDLVAQTYACALKKLRALSEAEYTAVLAELMLQAAPDGKGEVILSKADRRAGKAAVERANRTCGGSLRLSGETRPMEGGFVLKNGKVEINCTFETLIRLQQTETAGMVAARLFG